MEPTPIFQFTTPTTGATHLVCASCKADGLPFGAAPLAVEAIPEAVRADLTPEHRCAFCRTPLLPAGKLKHWLERLGFIFTVDGDRSAWVQVRTAGRRVLITVLALPGGEHAPLDDEDGAVLLRRADVGIPSLAPVYRQFVLEEDVTCANLSTAVQLLLEEREASIASHPMLEKFLGGSRS